MNTFGTQVCLLLEFGSVEIELSKIAGRYFGLEEREARRRAAANRLPIPAHRLNGQKSPWMVHLAHLAAYIDGEVAKSVQAFERSKAA